ncbi:MAG: single-stranded DNA-binding protein [Chloroflexi bacterium]|nr:single-stranded DNA-binding protein [Chloroflexota bacterium]
MAGICKITAIGNIGKEPELRYSQAGRAWCRFRMAVNRPVGQGADGERKEETMWFSVVTFGQVAERCANFAKGRLVYVDGRFQTRLWESREGQKMTDLEIIANDVFLLDRPRPALEPEEAAVGTGGTDDQTADELPF